MTVYHATVGFWSTPDHHIPVTLPSETGEQLNPVKVGADWSYQPATAEGPLPSWTVEVDAERLPTGPATVTVEIFIGRYVVGSVPPIFLSSDIYAAISGITTRGLYSVDAVGPASVWGPDGFVEAGYFATTGGVVVHAIRWWPTGAPPPTVAAIPLRQSSRTDGLVGAGRQQRPTIRQGRVSGPATIRGGA